MVVNSCCHRAYNIKGTEIQIKMFDDRIVFETPGDLPGLVRPDNIHHTHFSRNPKIGERKFFLEAKKPCVHIEREDDPAKQVRRYGFTAGLKISVLSNFEHLYVYDTSYPVEQNDTRVKAIVREYKYTDYEDAAEELLEYLGKDAVYKDEVWKSIEVDLKQWPVVKQILNHINRLKLAV